MRNPFFNRGPIQEPRFYFPRPRETREIVRLLAGSQNCSLVGPIKSGKTSLLFHLTRPGTMAGYGFTVDRHSAIYLSFEGLGHLSQEQFFHLMVQETARQSPGKLAMVWPRFETRNAISFLELKETLDQIETAGERLVFLLDEVELATSNPAFDLNFFSALRHVAARPGVCFVTATDCRLHEVAVAGREIGSPFADLFSTVRLQPLDPDEAWLWVHSLAVESGVELEPERDLVTGLGGGVPFHLQLAAFEAFESKRGPEPLTEGERLYVASRAYEQVEPVFVMMWGRMGDSERRAALAGLDGGATAEVEGFTCLRRGHVVPTSGLAERFLRERQRDQGVARSEALDSASSDRTMMYNVVRVLMRAVEGRNRYVRGHADQVSRLAAAVARELGCADEVVEGVRVAARLHDIGYVSISDMILLKPGPLSELEAEIMRTHPVIGAQVLDAIEFPWAVKPAVRYHHERLDGSGYPEGLVGDEIPLSARILGAADVISAMMSERPYRPARSQTEALVELTNGAGAKYDPLVVGALVRVVERGRQ
ncbi:MAG: HD domain-containing phosphohydrolase [Armatimonadota bacterium]